MATLTKVEKTALKKYGITKDSQVKFRSDIIERMVKRAKSPTSVDLENYGQVLLDSVAHNYQQEYKILEVEKCSWDNQIRFKIEWPNKFQTLESPISFVLCQK